MCYIFLWLFLSQNLCLMFLLAEMFFFQMFIWHALLLQISHFREAFPDDLFCSLFTALFIRALIITQYYILYLFHLSDSLFL